MRTKTNVRHDEIRRLLLKNELVTVSEFCKALDCCEATIRNDLRVLESEQLIKRVPGGAISVGNTPLNLGIDSRFSASYHAKANIAEYAFRRFIQPNSTIILDAGTTTYLLAQQIVNSNLSLRVVTNSLSAAGVLANNPSISLLLCGGFYDSNVGAFWDDTAIETIRSIHAHQCFLAVNGVDENSLTITIPAEGAIKQAMCDSADEIIVVADHMKIGQIAFKRICDTSRADAIVTDENEISKAKVESLINAGIRVEITKGDASYVRNNA